MKKLKLFFYLARFKKWRMCGAKGYNPMLLSDVVEFSGINIDGFDHVESIERYKPGKSVVVWRLIWNNK